MGLLIMLFSYRNRSINFRASRADSLVGLKSGREPFSAILFLHISASGNVGVSGSGEWIY